MYLFVCLHFCQFLSLSLFLFFLFVYLSTSLSVCLSLYLPSYLSLSQPDLSVTHPPYITVFMSLFLSFYLSMFAFLFQFRLSGQTFKTSIPHFFSFNATKKNREILKSTIRTVARNDTTCPFLGATTIGIRTLVIMTFSIRTFGH